MLLGATMVCDWQIQIVGQARVYHNPEHGDGGAFGVVSFHGLLSSLALTSTLCASLTII